MFGSRPRGVSVANASAKRDKIRRDIFISYRREDSAEVVDRIYGELEAAYPGRVFRDISEMQGGLDFEDQVKHQLQQCQAALVVIGPDWLNIRDSDGNLRLQNKGDYVRIEIESVLAREALRVFPLLVKGTTLPIPDAVPPSLRPLLRRHGYPIRRDPDFKPDIARLIVALDVTLGISRHVAKTRRLLFFGLGFLTAAALALTFDEQTFQIVEDAHDFIKHNYAKLTKQPLMAGRADLDRWKGSILALQASNGGFRFGPRSEPQVWSTAQCLTALLASPLDLKEDHDKIVRGFQFIESSRDAKADGWGLFEDSLVAQTDIAAWVCVANAQLLASTRSKLFADQVPDARRRISRDLESIARCQLPSPKGAWSPIWVPDKMVPDLARTYSTIMALWALAEARDVSDIHEEIGSKYDVAIDDGVSWLLASFRPGVGLPAAPSIGHSDIPFPGLTAQAIYVLRRIERARPYLRNLGADSIAKEIFLKLVNTGEPFQSRDVLGGQVSDLRPTKYKLESSSFARFPWFLLATSSLRNDDALSAAPKERAAECFERLKFRSGGLDTHLRTAETWEIAETLYCVSRALEQDKDSEW
jgi:TIR domain